MNGIERITSRIEADAQAEIARILADAESEAAQITAHYRAAADAERTERMAKNERTAAERKERLLSAAQMEGRKVQLSAKQAMVEQAYVKALEKLQSLPEAQYVDLLAALLVQASVSGEEEVVFSEKDCKGAGEKAVAKVNAACGKALRIAEDVLAAQGGFILRDRYVEVNCTFETLVRLQRAETAGAVTKILFPE